jgi:tryptophanyl-tRNA synthetase
MARVLTGIQSTGVPHLGNLLGAIIPGVSLSEEAGNDAFFFIADLHSMTTIRDPEIRRKNTRAVAAAWLACGFNTEKGTFYRQSDVTEVTEMAWYLSCYMSYNRLKLAHSFKDKAERVEQVNAGLFNYPVLMAADILCYDADIVPVGKDQKQHIEFTRDLAELINREYGDTLVVPKARIQKDSMVVPGTDGFKMSKSRHNVINIFQSDKALKKEIMGIVTDSTPLEEPKDPDKNVIFQLFSLISEPGQVQEMRENFLKGGYGYGHAKTALYNRILERFAHVRDQYQYFMDHPEELEDHLDTGAVKAHRVAGGVLARLREKLGFRKSSQTFAH